MNLFRWLFVVGIISMLTYSCRRDDYYEGRDVNITFSEDTLRFDTVFTTLGSATRFVKLKNSKNQPVLVDVKLKNLSNLYFRINVDGVKGSDARNVEISANDSIYVFVEVTIDPNKPLSISPFIIEDQIEVTVNGNTSILYLEAWGQNANYITPTDGKGKSYLYSCNFGERIWNDPKPYVIYGILYIDSCKVVWPAGTRIYVHGGIVRDTLSIYNDGLMVFLKDGSLDSRGTIAQPVIIQGDRLEKEFEDVKSQWVGMLFWQQSINNRLSNTIIKNSIIGIRADSMAQLAMYGCQINNTGSTALIGRHANIYAENCLFSDNASYGIQLTYGGNYTFNYCTVGNYQGQNAAISLDDVHCGDFFCSPATRRLNHLKATFNNCIFAGNDKDEVQLNRFGKGQVNFDYMFKNCVVKVDELILPKNYPDFFDFCTSCINVKSNDKLFLKRNDGDFRLDTMSVALGKALPLPNVPRDIINKMRKPKPDIGCFEF